MNSPKILLTVVLFLIVLAGCSGDNTPTSNVLKSALIQEIAGHVEIENFSVQASQNLGNEVEPVILSRFKAVASTGVDLYNVDSRQGGVTFVRLNKAKKTKIDVFGKITSKLYQGMWRHAIDIDGTPISNLGIPLNQISAGRIIIRGSDEEKHYYAEIKQKEIEHQKEVKRKAAERRKEVEREAAELRKNLANAESIVVGTWREKCDKQEGLMIYKKDGTFSGKWNNKDYEGVWNIKGDIFNVTYKGLKLEPVRIVDINNNYFETKTKRSTCKHTRIK